jgi:hypothetical protein
LERGLYEYELGKVFREYFEAKGDRRRFKTDSEAPVETDEMTV